MKQIFNKQMLGELREHYSEVEALWEKNLKQHKVKLPGFETQHGVSLAYLWKHRDRKDYVSKVELTAFYAKLINKPGQPELQARHLCGTYGFHLVFSSNKDKYLPDMGDAHYQLLTLDQPAPTWNPEAKEDRLKAGTWEELKEAYDNKCATCGSVEGEPHNYPKHRDQITKLERGHMHPGKALEKGNAVPQCQICNGQYKDRFIFDENGWVSALYKAEIIKKSPVETRQAVLELLLKDPELSLAFINNNQE